MHKSQKLFESIGRLDDEDLALALEYKAEQPAKPRMRFSAIMAAAVVAVGIMLTAFTYGDEILNAIFKRQTELVDDKIGYIDESATVGNITLTVDKVKVDSKAYHLDFIQAEYTVSFHKEDGIFDKGLKYGKYAVEVLLDADDPKVANNDSLEVQDGKKWYVLPNADEGAFDIFNPALLDINYGLDNPSDTVTLTSILDLTLYGKSRIIFYDITSADGSVKYADEISVEFEVTEEKAPPLQQLDILDPDISFEVEGVEFKVSYIELNPEYMRVEVQNPTADRVNIGGNECYAMNYFTKCANSDESFELYKKVEALDREKAEYYEEKYADSPQNVYIEKYYSEWLASDERAELEAEQAKLNYKTDDEKLLAECYEIAVEIKPESGAQITGMNTSLCSWLEPNTITAGMTAYFSSPIYVEDIVRVYARKIGDPTKEVTIWVPAEDEALQNLAE